MLQAFNEHYSGLSCWQVFFKTVSERKRARRGAAADIGAPTFLSACLCRPGRQPLALACDPGRQEFVFSVVRTHSTASHFSPWGGQPTEKEAMGRPRPPGFPVVRPRSHECAREKLVFSVVRTHSTASHFSPWGGQPTEKEAMGRPRPPGFPRRPSSVPRMRQGEISV